MESIQLAQMLADLSDLNAAVCPIRPYALQPCDRVNHGADSEGAPSREGGLALLSTLHRKLIHYRSRKPKQPSRW